MILSEGEVALFARFADETLDVFEPPDAGLERLLSKEARPTTSTKLSRLTVRRASW